MCRGCEKKDVQQHPYLVILYDLYLLQEAGFPLDAEAIELQTWRDLAQLRMRIKARTWES